MAVIITRAWRGIVLVGCGVRSPEFAIVPGRTIAYHHPAHAESALRAERAFLVRAKPRLHFELVLSSIFTEHAETGAGGAIFTRQAISDLRELADVAAGARVAGRLASVLLEIAILASQLFSAALFAEMVLRA